MSQEIIPRVPAVRVSAEPSFFRREPRTFFSLFKNTLPIAANRFVVYCCDLGVYTWVASRHGSDFFAGTVIPLSYMDASYWIISALFGRGINIVKERVGAGDSRVAEYFFAGAALGAGIPLILTLPGFAIVSTVLKLSSQAKRFGYVLTGDVISRDIKMHSRQVMIGTGHRVWRLDGSYVALSTALLEAGTFLGLSLWWVDGVDYMGFIYARLVASLLKISLDSFFMGSSGSVFRCPRWRHVFEEAKSIVREGWAMSGQVFVELLVVSFLPILATLEKAQARLIAWRIASALDGFLAPWTGAWVRGLQRMINRGGDTLENIGLSHRTFGITALSALIPVSLYVGLPRKFLSLFTSDVEVLDVGESILRMFSAGQFFYILYAFLQSTLWVLFDDTSFSMGTSLVAALIYFGITLPLVITENGDFDLAMGMFVLYTGIGTISLLGRYINRAMQAGEEVEQGENLADLGLFSRCRRRPAYLPTQTVPILLNEDQETDVGAESSRTLTLV